MSLYPMNVVKMGERAGMESDRRRTRISLANSKTHHIALEYSSKYIVEYKVEVVV